MSKIIHYSRDGYNGNFTYTSVCGKKVRTHQENECSSIYPRESNCVDCIKSKQYQADLRDTNNTDPSIKKRIYIESDILQASEVSSARRELQSLCKEKNLKYVERGFSRILDMAWHDLENTWESVRWADEIYAKTSLVPLVGGSYTGAPVIFNGMCERAIKENITGKEIYILNTLDNLEWDMINIPLMKKAFKNNNLWMWNDNYDFEKVNIKKIKK